MTGSFQGDTYTAQPGGELGEQHAHDLADKIRLLAATDPQLAQDLVDQLIAALDQATGGAFRDLWTAAGTVGEPQLSAGEPGGRAGASLPAS